MAGYIRKTYQENYVVPKREVENARRNQWQETARYFHDANVAVAQQEKWTSGQCFNDSMDTFRSQQEKEHVVLRLQTRRQRLADMLQKERDAYEVELRGMSARTPGRMRDMKDKVEILKTAREEERKQVAQEMMYEHWKMNHPELRKVESEQLQNHVIDSWAEQREEKTQRKVEEKMRDEELEQEYVRRMEQAAIKQRKEEERRFEQQKEVADFLRVQMEEIKAREQESEILRDQEKALMEEQMYLDEYDEDKRRFEEQRKKEELGRQLMRQHKNILKRKTKEVQQELEADLKLIGSLEEQEKTARQAVSARRDQLRADAAWMRQVIEDQLEVEKKREKEFDMLYQEEAAREWKKREAEWEKERVAREKLMAQVLQERQLQLEERLSENKQRQMELIGERETLVQDMETATHRTKRETEQRDQAKEARRRELEEQIQQREVGRQDEMTKEQRDKEFAIRNERQFDEMLARETSRMRLQGYQPKDYSRASSRATSRATSRLGWP